jgi:hypothetical protein
VPDAWKRQVVRRHLRERGLRSLVETGTWQGGMASALQGDVDRLVTIELDPALAARARSLLEPWPHVKVLEGDSGKVLPQVLRSIDVPCCFWLDAHDSGPGTARGDRETPLRQEVEAIVAHPVAGHVVLIDDAHLLGRGDYPTLAWLRETFERAWPGCEIEIADSILSVRGRDGHG